MASLNKVLLIGNLTRDPEIRYTPSGSAVGDLRLAVSRKYRTQDGQDHEETCFVTVTVWGRSAETCGEYLRKGSPLLVEGRLKYEEWEKDGQKSNRLSVVAERTQFLGSPRGALQDGPSGPAAARPQPPSAARGSAPTPPPQSQTQTQAQTQTPPPAAAPNELEADDDNLPF